MGESRLVITLKDDAGRPVDGAKLDIECNMSHAGMTPVMAHSETSAQGVYIVPIQWTMGGDWYVDVKFTLHDGQVITRRFAQAVR